MDQSRVAQSTADSRALEEPASLLETCVAHRRASQGRANRAVKFRLQFNSRNRVDSRVEYRIYWNTVQYNEGLSGVYNRRQWNRVHNDGVDRL